MLYSLGVGWILRGEGAPLPAQILAGQRRWQSPIDYDFLYPIFCAAAQAGNRVGEGLRQDPTEMPCMSTGVDHRPRTAPQAGARSAS
jgi:hypothetical protein